MKRATKKSISRRIRRAEINAPTEPLLTASELKAIAERIMKFSEADETEVEIDVTTDALTRFANNIIHQNVAEQVLHISVRAVMDGRTARATTNKTDEESLRRVMAAAEKARAASAEDSRPASDAWPAENPQSAAIFLSDC